MIQWQTADAGQRVMVRCAFIGPTRSGKTSVCASFPNPMFIFPKNEDSKTTLMGSGYPFVEVGSMRETEEVLEQLAQMQQAGAFVGQDRTVIFENLSHYADIMESEITRGGVVDLDWNKYKSHFKRIRDLLWSLSDCHVVVTALDNVKTDKRGNVVHHGPKVSGQSADTLVSSCTLVGYCDQEPATPDRLHSRWVVHTQTAGLFQAGTRIPGMPPGIHENFNFFQHIAPYLPQYRQPPPRV
jgi:hypothetical protein